MKTSLLPSLVALLGTLSFAAEAERPTLTATPAGAASSPPAAASTANATPERPRTTSPELSAKLGESLPKFAPPPATATPPSPVGTPAPLPAETASIDFSANEVIRLPNYDVREEELPTFKERELLTPEGRVDAALKRFPGLKFGPFAQLNIRRGLELLEQEREGERRAELRELYDFVEFVDALPRSTAEPPSSAAAE